MNQDYEKELEFAKGLAVDAKKISDKYFRSELDFKTKADSSPVTIADEQINQIVIDRVKKVFPEFGVLGEEQSWQKDRDYLWVCDPIDGTVGFSMGEPLFTFALALVFKGKPVVAVVCELANGRLFWATKGGGAYVDGKTMSVSSRPIEKSWLAFGSNLNKLLQHQDIYKRLAAASYQVDLIHGSVFKGMLVAQGLADATLFLGEGHPWDFAVSKLIVEEAGGRVVNVKGQDDLFNDELPNGVVMTNKIIEKDILKIINEKVK
jgi:fructose-1,6-bisphosphatase/inositol monophosphatase family enzyme